MARRRKNRTHMKGGNALKEEAEQASVPKSFVIKSGESTTSLSTLVRDFRRIMEPHTASRLRERHAARLRDYLVMAGPLKVSHILIFTLTDAANVHLRVARIPQGPTMTFRVQRYSLMRDLVNASLRNVGKAPSGEYRTPPLLVLNNFQQPAGQPPKPQLKLMATMFQGMFPPIQVQKSALPSFRRVLLVSYHSDSNLISIRHYVISVRPHGVSRRVKKILDAATAPETSKSAAKTRVNLSSAEDIADYLLRRGNRGETPGTEDGTTYDSASETDASEAESDTNAVELPDDYVGRGNKKGQRKAVRLIEVGPRLELKLIKITEGLVGSKKGEGETVFHEFVHKSKSEAAALNASHKERQQLREQRRKQQEANVARKQQPQKGKQSAEGEVEGTDDEVDVSGEMPEVEGLSDDEFAFEDRYGNDVEDEELDEEAEISEGDEGDDEDEDSSEDEEPQPQPRKRSKK